MDRVRQFYPLFKVAIELGKPETQNYFSDLKFLCKCQDCNTPFEFLNKLIQNIDIEVYQTPHNYAFLTKHVKECSFNPSAPQLYQQIGRNILTFLGATSAIPPVVASVTQSTFSKDSPLTEADAEVRGNKLKCSAVFAKFDIDHLCGMSWPSSLYKEFREKTGNLIREQISEMDTSDVTTVEECNSKLLPLLQGAKCETVIIVICGFSACISENSTVCNFILPSPNAKVANAVYNLQNLYRLIDMDKTLARKKTIIVLLTLPSKKLRFEDEEFITQEQTHKYYLPVKSVILASSVATIRNLKRIVNSENELRNFYENLLNNPMLAYFDNRLDKKLIFLENRVREVNSDRGLFCYLSFNGAISEHFETEINEKIVKFRDWIFNDYTQLELGYLRKEYESLIEDFVTALKPTILKNKIECIIVFINRDEEWDSKEDSIETYANILTHLADKIISKYGLPTICFIQDNLWYKIIKGRLTQREEFIYTPLDTKQFEKIVSVYPKLYFVLPYESYGIDLFNELNEPHSRSLRDLNAANMNNKARISGKKNIFSKVICQSEEMDFIFPPPKYVKVDDTPDT